MANNKRYEGTRLQGGPRMVTVTSGLDTHPLSFPADLVGSDFHFTAAVFIWGYRGSGPRDLAAALAYDLLSAHKGSLFHLRLARNFESPIYTEIVVCLPSEGWVLNDHEIIESRLLAVCRRSPNSNPASKQPPRKINRCRRKRAFGEFQEVIGSGIVRSKGARRRRSVLRSNGASGRRSGSAGSPIRTPSPSHRAVGLSANKRRLPKARSTNVGQSSLKYGRD